MAVEFYKKVVYTTLCDSIPETTREVPLTPPNDFSHLFDSPLDNISSEDWDFTEDEAKEAFFQSIASKRCSYPGRKSDIIINKVENLSVYRYILETHAEGRKLSWKHEAYKGQPVQKYSTVPGPWEVQVVPPAPFTDSEVKVIVPETTTICTCHRCDGVGCYVCRKCHGKGKIVCVLCKLERLSSSSSSFVDQLEWCYCCHGKRRITCFMCHGSRYETCSYCDGYKQVIYYIELTVQWKSYKDEHVVEWTGLPEELVSIENGHVILSEESRHISPLKNFLDDDICIGSAVLLGLHGSETAKKQQRIIRQRHCVIVIPAAEVSYSWKNHKGTFHMYGSERKIYFLEDVPQQNCCTVL